MLRSLVSREEQFGDSEALYVKALCISELGWSSQCLHDVAAPFQLWRRGVLLVFYGEPLWEMVPWGPSLCDLGMGAEGWGWSWE